MQRGEKKHDEKAHIHTFMADQAPWYNVMENLSLTNFCKTFFLHDLFVLRSLKHLDVFI